MTTQVRQQLYRLYPTVSSFGLIKNVISAYISNRTPARCASGWGGLAEWLDGRKHFKCWVDTRSIPMRWVPMPLKVGTEPGQRTALVKSGVKLPEPLQVIPISSSASWPFWIRNWGRVENQTRKKEQASQRTKEVPMPTQRTLKPSNGSPVRGWRGLTVPWGWPGSLFLSLWDVRKMVPFRGNLRIWAT